MKDLNDIGVYGLGVMGASLARNLASRGYKVAGYNRSPEVSRRLQSAHPEAAIEILETPEAFVRALAWPRKILVMVQAGAPVDDVLHRLDPLLEEGDVVVDGGNSLYLDTEHRGQEYRTRPWDFIGMGVSGGEEGALLGPSLMPGGPQEAFERLRPVLESIAARSASGPCVTHCGSGSAGHFVKMVHNGIEYGDMQLIAETVALLRQGLGLSAERAAEAFEDWNRGELDSYLVEVAAEVLRAEDPERPGSPLVDAILDQAGQKGTGRWTVMAAAELGVPIPTIAAAVEARSLSAQRGRRLRAAELFPEALRPLEGIALSDLEEALYAAKLASYAQGFDLLSAGSEARGYGTELGELARIWTGGCIIRARLLDAIREAYGAEPDLELLCFAPSFRDALLRRLPAWRRVVAGAASAGLPVPGLSASLAWFDSLRLSRGSAYLIQAQRDYFGAHTYERLDRPGVAIHTEWAGLRRMRT